MQENKNIEIFQINAKLLRLSWQIHTCNMLTFDRDENTIKITISSNSTERKKAFTLSGRPRYLVLGTSFDFYIIFFWKVVPGTKCSSKIFQKFFGSKNKAFVDR
jgi:hypothetical protein